MSTQMYLHSLCCFSVNSGMRGDANAGGPIGALNSEEGFGGGGALNAFGEALIGNGALNSLLGVAFCKGLLKLFEGTDGLRPFGDT